MDYVTALRGAEIILNWLYSTERYYSAHICYDDDGVDYRFDSASEFRILMHKKYGKETCSRLFKDNLSHFLIVHLDDEIVNLLLIGECYKSVSLKDVIQYTYDRRKDVSECAEWHDGIWFVKHFEKPEIMLYYMLEKCSKRLCLLYTAQLRPHVKAAQQLDDLFRV